MKISELCDLSGKRAIVTGASGGLGAHFAHTLAGHGAEVILAARRLEKLETVKTGIEEAGGRAIVVQMDVTSVESVTAAFADIQKDGAPPADILVNNSGISQWSRALETTEDEWASVMGTNLTGVWRVAQHAAKAMAQAERPGSIINIGSITGLRPQKMVAGYGASKAAVGHLTKDLALELARFNIRVNAIAPGYFKTPINDEFLESEAGQTMRKRITMRKFGDYKDLNGPLLLLASDAGAYMTGTTIVVDGGHTLSSL